MAFYIQFLSSVNTDSFNSFLIWMPFILFHFISFSWLLLFTHSVMSDCLRPHGLWHARLPCPLPPPRVHWNSCPLYWWCHPTISSSVIPFFSCLQSFSASGSFASVWKLQGLEWMARLFKHWERSFSNSSPSSINDQGTGSPQSLLMQENSLIFLTNLFQVPLQQLA